MAWSVTDWTTKPAWNPASLLNQFVGSVNERKSAIVQGAPFATVVHADIVQAATFFTAFQQWIEANRGSFVVSHDGVLGESIPRAGGHYDGWDLLTNGEIPKYANLAAVFDAAGLEHSGWRRYTTHPDEAGVVAYGQMQAGDIIGPWIFEDIQKCLNVLVWTRPTISSREELVEYRGDGASGVSYAAARAAAEAAWTSIADSGRYYTQSYQRFPSGVYTARLERVEFKCAAVNVWNGCTRHADWYILPTVPIYVGGTRILDSYGDFEHEHDRWYSLWSRDEPVTNATTIVSAAKIGDAATMPNNPWSDAPGSRGWDHIQPWWGAVIVRWNVAGGFTYAA